MKLWQKFNKGHLFCGFLLSVVPIYPHSHHIRHFISPSILFFKYGCDSFILFFRPTFPKPTISPSPPWEMPSTTCWLLTIFVRKSNSTFPSEVSTGVMVWNWSKVWICVSESAKVELYMKVQRKFTSNPFLTVNPLKWINQKMCYWKYNSCTMLLHPQN